MLSDAVAPAVKTTSSRCAAPIKARDTVARRFVTLRRLLGQTMYAAVDIGVQLPMQVIDRIDHATRLLRRSSAIEVDQRAAVHLGREQRKIRTYLFQHQTFLHPFEFRHDPPIKFLAKRFDGTMRRDRRDESSICNRRACCSLRPRCRM